MDLSEFGIFIVSRNCEPCLFQSKHGVVATEFCVDCQESHCSGCARKHGQHKLSASHIETAIKTTLSQCQPCKESSIESYCGQCKEFYCKDCGNYHKAQKCSRDHKLIDISLAENNVVLLLEENGDDTVLKNEGGEACSHTGTAEMNNSKRADSHNIESNLELKDAHKVFNDKDQPRNTMHSDKKSIQNTDGHLEMTEKPCQSNRELHADINKTTIDFPVPSGNRASDINHDNAQKDASASYPNSPKKDYNEIELKNDLYHVQEDSARQCSDRQMFKSYKGIEFHPYRQKEDSETNEGVASEEISSTHKNENMPHTTKHPEVSTREEKTQIQHKLPEEKETICKVKENKRVAPEEISSIENNENMAHAVEQPEVSTREENSQIKRKVLEERTYKEQEIDRLPESTAADLKKSMETRRNTPDHKRKDPKQPGKPCALYVQSNHLTLKWPDLALFEKNDALEVFLKEAKYGSWRPYKYSSSIYDTNTSCLIEGLRPDTQYVFKIRLMNERTGKSGPFSSVSDVVQTKPSPAMLYKSKSSLLRNSMVYQLPMVEDRKYLDKENKIRKYDIGHQASTLHEKTILLIGESGSGKSTMIDCLANYSLGVTVQDPFRFTLTCGENADGQNTMVRPRQTEWITIYALHPSKESAFPFVFNLIDTPGLGRTKRMNNDEALITSIEVLLKNVEKVDVVGLVVKSSDSRLSVSQRLLFDSFLDLFGDTISENMCALITFCDSQTPPVVNAMRSFHRALPSNNCFCFNNGSLFSNENQESNREAFWKMGKVQFDLLLGYLSTVISQTLILTPRQLQVREEITYEIQRLEQVLLKTVCLVDNVIKKENTIHQQKDTEQFELETEVMESIQRPVSYQNQKVMTCTHCRKTCCRNFPLTKDYDIKHCPIFRSNGFCKMCRPRLCHYSEHINTDGVMEFVPVKRKTVFQVLEMERRNVKRELHQERHKLILSLLVILEEITKKHNALQKKARHPVQRTTLEQINNLIDITSNDGQSYPSGTKHILLTLKAELEYQKHAISRMRVDDVIKELDIY